MGLVYIDGKFVPKEEAKVSVFDHAFLYGDAVFEGIRAYNGRVFRLEEHIDRLYDSARAIWLEIKIPKKEMMEIVAESCRKNNLKDAYIRLVVTRGVGDLGLDPRKCHGNASIVCIADKIALYPEEFYEKGLKAITAATRRNYGEVLAPQVKSNNYLPNIMAKIEAITAGCLEAICMSREGFVTEGTGDNIFIVKDGTLKTPHPAVGILKGVTRKAIMELAEQEGIPVEETFMNRFDVYTADEIFFTGTAAEVIPVVEVDSRKIGEGVPGPITKKLRSLFMELVKKEGYPI
ncbi:branched-chain amino acid aminotransferase [Thermovirga lienii DSM 17291]|uniref:Branched-chain-amino-acid aminotransferase n=1 Tax=Thermovirga lienii (strain ATCC BAA-1197 / DSM 17291 / Cas60314) TaxID=580340 RepID=G7V896_THELD|nr:branched-chain-amino-acid transaminase [Thermovirga lienii]AER67427.1 branched-chain amino acid aminotransferase [Thermovirga lienii DSM 17291]KUK42753.1 MAG: Branched-chain amino acid aminotransferase [Thermovirga lienii]MDN5319465.1 branched-chain amino acid aminotransferase [Thermovirga sp.]MDN5368324.1 branched-chain amino acid aminotransferase [Thermovirga sp.]